MVRPRVLSLTTLAMLASTAWNTGAVAQRSLAQRIDRIVDAPPFDRATWGILVVDSRGRERYARNADRLLAPASNAKLVVSAAASALLPPDYRAVTSVYGTGPLVNGTLEGDLIVYGRGDPTFSARCYGTDTLAVGACDSLWTRMGALADSIVASGVRSVAGGIVGDGSYFEPALTHPAWQIYDANWWYAARVSGLGFNDNSLNLTWGAGDGVNAPAVVAIEPDLQLFEFENRTRTVPAGGKSTIDFYRRPGTREIWAEGTVPMGRRPGTEYFAVPDPNLYFAAALRHVLAERGVNINGPTGSTVDSLQYAYVRRVPPLVSFESRPLTDWLFPILNASQNWFAEMLLKVVGREIGGEGSWDTGLSVERRFLIDSVGVDSTAIGLTDGSGLASNNVITPRALVRVLRFMHQHPNAAAFLGALPRSGQVGSLSTRFVGTPLEGRVVAKTGTLFRVNSLSGYIERANGEIWTFSVIVNHHNARYNDVVRAIDGVVTEIGRE